MGLIYVVEDDRDISEIESFALKNSGYDVQVYENGADFYRAVRERVEGWFTGERLGRGLPRAQLIALIFSVEGVANCALVRPEADLPLDSVTLPVLGTLTITKGEGE